MLGGGSVGRSSSAARASMETAGGAAIFTVLCFALQMTVYILMSPTLIARMLHFNGVILEAHQSIPFSMYLSFLSDYCVVFIAFAAIILKSSLSLYLVLRRCVIPRTTTREGP